MTAAYNIIMNMQVYQGAKLIDDGKRHRYITSIYYDGAYIINGKAGERRYIDYTLREAMKHYNRLCRG